MADELYQPHDKLFRAVFSDTAEAAGLLQAALPATLRDSLDWPTLTLIEGTFLDEDLRESESDLLYEVEHVGSGEPVALYLLFEHQSSPDRWIRFRLLKYCCRIWDASFRDRPEQDGLRPIVPVVFYQGPRGWTHSTELADLFPEATRSWPWVPRFEHVLLDQTKLEPEAVAGGLKGRIVQLLMMVAFKRHMSEALERAAQAAAVMAPGGGIDDLRQFLAYLMTTQDQEVVETFSEALRRYGIDKGGEIVTYAQQLLAEGEAKGLEKGRAEGLAEGLEKGRVEVVEGLLRSGVRWEVIEAATGLNESRFRSLKDRLEAAGR